MIKPRDAYQIAFNLVNAELTQALIRKSLDENVYRHDLYCTREFLKEKLDAIDRDEKYGHLL